MKQTDWLKLVAKTCTACHGKGELRTFHFSNGTRHWGFGKRLTCPSCVRAAKAAKWAWEQRGSMDRLLVLDAIDNALHEDWASLDGGEIEIELIAEFDTLHANMKKVML